ncbi:hypothetical protein ACT6QG_13175 [Xanthobacter sp. TB0136]|uniref:hypothetical protein n=1 Tax=Xanthobacter sp. TB0136 TaxID=3459177 RepID=UPI00403A4E73
MRKTRTLAVTALAGLLLGASPLMAQPAVTPAETDVVEFPGRGAVEVLSYPAKFVSADVVTRHAIFEGANGKRWSVVIPAGVADLSALKNGENVTVRVLPAVVTALGKAHQGTPGEIIEQVAVNEGLPGLPEGYGLVSVTMTTIFVGVDKAAGTVTFEGLGGKVHTVRAFDEKVLEDLQKVEPGDLSQISYLEGISLTTP